MKKKLGVIWVERENKVVLKRGGIFKSIVWVTKYNFTISFVRNVKVTVNFKMLPKKEQEVFYVQVLRREILDVDSILENVFTLQNSFRDLEFEVF